ncbi:RNA 2',3'-cyclic phosphodiesterase [Chloroflexota bacterium]
MVNFETIRAFIAIELPAEVKQYLYGLQAKLKADNQPRIKWVKPEGIHLTLKFLGEVETSMLEPITQAMEDAATAFSPFKLGVQQPGVFPSLQRVQVVWLGLGGEVDKLKQLHKHLDTNLTKLGFAAEQRQFKPHLTLARMGNEASVEQRQQLGDLIATTRLEAGQTIKVEGISLIKSQLTKGGAFYSRISFAGLMKQPSTDNK